MMDLDDAKIVVYRPCLGPTPSNPSTPTLPYLHSWRLLSLYSDAEAREAAGDLSNPALRHVMRVLEADKESGMDVDEEEEDGQISWGELRRRLGEGTEEDMDDEERIRIAKGHWQDVAEGRRVAASVCEHARFSSRFCPLTLTLISCLQMLTISRIGRSSSWRSTRL